MTECKDCIHYEVCAIEVVINTAINGNCKFFKDKSKIIKLPCKVGDEIYEICERRKNGEWRKVIVKRIIDSFEYGAEDVGIIHCGTTISVFTSDLNKTVFLTKDEAEQALRESENNVNR